MLAENSYLPPEERAKRAKRKREELILRGLTPDWFLNQESLCLPPGMRVAVIGAGFAGLSAAWYLAECGVRTTIYEASGSVGGRVRTNRAFVAGKVVEDGAELIGENHPLWGLHVIRFGLKLNELTDDEVSGLNVRTRFVGNDLTKAQKEALDAALQKHFATIGAAGSAIDEVTPWRSPDARAADGISVAAMLDKLLGKEPSLERMWFNFTLSNDNCADVSKQSYLSLLASVSAARMGSDAPGMLGYWYSTETHRCDGGNDILANRLTRQLKDLRIRNVVQRVRIEAAFVPQVRIISAEYDAGGAVLQQRTDDVDYVVLAVPPTVWSVINFDPPFDPAGRAMQHGAAVKFMSRYNTRFWEATKLAPTAKWDELGSVWEGTDSQGPALPIDLTVFSGGPYVLPASAYPGRLATLYPAKSPDGTPTAQHFMDWPNEPFIGTGYAVPGVGEVTTISPNQIAPHAQRLYFAGEQTSPGFFGYMEGALQSGARAARDIVKSAAIRYRYASRCKSGDGRSSDDY
ncbi:monoamine oxidase [Caballeronia calidae]|uniref:Monoamine oxidase n=1 Tax=Caballeronia calidae TaxID=1777139 RepID=A0A158EJV2_9BURK|nr:NAD(P)/FAD-dependent oxidoreductase [Caballeronia calidae]SAL06187.1 monoamine oxidase [Caballeronia calidae]